MRRKKLRIAFILLALAGMLLLASCTAISAQHISKTDMSSGGFNGGGQGMRDGANGWGGMNGRPSMNGGGMNGGGGTRGGQAPTNP